MSLIELNITYQRHNGSGDNVGGNKIVNLYQSIAPEELQKPIELILSDIREKNTHSAKIRLETIKAQSTLDANSRIILDGLSFHLNLLEDKDKKNLFNSLITFLKTSSDGLTRDLCQATLIRLEAESNRSDDARERYLKIDQPGPYFKEAFFELIATADELECGYGENTLNLGENELNGLVRGFFRTENPTLALKVANRLNNVFPSFNSKVLVLFAKGTTLLNEKLLGTYFWTITATLKAELIELIEEVVSLINESNGQDKRLLNVAAPCLQYILGDHKELMDICWKHVDEIEKQHPDVAAQLHNIYKKDASKLKDGFVCNYVKAKQDKEYREQLLNDLTSSKEISVDKFLILKDFEFSKISQWGKSGGVVVGEEKLESDFRNLQLSLITLSGKNDRVVIENIRIQAEKFLNTYQEKLAGLNPFVLIELAENLLLHPELSLIVCNLVKPLLPASDLWASPIVKSYLNALLFSEQTATLSAILREINENEWDSELWIIQGNTLEQLANHTPAIRSIEIALELDCYSLNGWYCLVRMHRKLESSDEIVRSVLQRIPDEVLSKKSDAALTLLVEIAKIGDFNRAERIILSWFVENPDACAKAISDFNFNLTIGNITKDLVGFERVGDCVAGVVYTVDNVRDTKLLIDNPAQKHHCFLDINSPLGVFLNNMKAGEIKQYGMHDYKLIERLPVYVATFRIAVELRQKQNDGSDCFYVLQVPTDSDEMLAFLEKKLFRSQNNQDDEILNNPDIPVTFKGHFSYRNDPVKAALIQWSTKNSTKHQLPNFGECSPTKAVLDVYTIAYLALTGLAFEITKVSIHFVITQETKYFIEQWLKEINREDYLTMGARPGGGLWRVTADDIKQSNQHRQIQDALNLIIRKSEVVTPALVDMPPLILRIHDSVDESVYSSIKLSISNDIPWLCTDGMLAHLFHVSGWKSVDAFKLFAELGSTLSFEQKKEGLYLHAMECFPYALTFRDLNLLSASNDEHAHYFLAKIISLYPRAFTDTNIAVETLSRLLAPVLGNAYLDGEILRGLRLNNPRNNGYAERVFNACCYVSMQCNDGVQAELALAMLLCKLFTRFSAIPPMLKLICTMATAFANGHFLSIPLINQHIAKIDIS
ncbi:MAG: GapS6b family protein [Methylovulum sp.]